MSKIIILLKRLTLVLLICGVVFFYYIYNNSIPQIPNEINITIDPVLNFTGIGNNISTGSGSNIATTGDDNVKTVFKINYNCSFTGEGYQYIDIFNKDFYTPQEPNYQLYTKEVTREGKITEAYICIISNVRSDYKKRNAYYFSTYIYIGNEENAGHINTAFNLKNSLVYDNSTDKSFPYNGKFWGHEAPFGYILNLNKLIVSDKELGGFKSIYPLKLLNQNKLLRIGGFVNSYPNYWAGYIQKFRIIYKGGKLTVKK